MELAGRPPPVEPQPPSRPQPAFPWLKCVLFVPSSAPYPGSFLDQGPETRPSGQPRPFPVTRGLCRLHQPAQTSIYKGIIPCLGQSNQGANGRFYSKDQTFVFFTNSALQICEFSTVPRHCSTTVKSKHPRASGPGVSFFSGNLRSGTWV